VRCLSWHMVILAESGRENDKQSMATTRMEEAGPTEPRELSADRV
jgi:hypothetical protein